MNKVIDIDSFLGLSEGQLQTLDTLNVSGDESVHLAKLFKRNDSSYEKFFENLKRCHRLVDLSLSGQELESIPEGVFSQLRQLRVLDLSENELSHLPDDFNALAKTLKDLDLEDNKLEILPNLREFKNIKQLDCSGNITLDSLPDLPPFGRLDIDLVKKQSFLCVDEKLKDQVPEHLKPIMSYESTRYFLCLRGLEEVSQNLNLWSYGVIRFLPGRVLKKRINHPKTYCQGVQLRVQLALSYHISLSKTWTRLRAQLAVGHQIRLVRLFLLFSVA